MTSLSKKLITTLFAAVTAICLTVGILFAANQFAYADGETPNTVSLNADDLNIDSNILTGLKDEALERVKGADFFTFELPASVTGIAGGKAAEGDKLACGLFGEYTVKLTGITIPENSGLSTIADYAFYNSGLTQLDLSNASNLSGIGDFALAYSTKLTSVLFDGVTSIGDSAFLGCTALTEITIPSSVTTIGKSAFANCTKLTAINYYAVQIAAFSSDLDNPFRAAGRDGSGLTLTIGKAAAEGQGITVNSIPGNFFNIGTANATQNKINVKKIVFANVSASAVLGDSAFINCTALESVDLGKNLQTIGTSAFRGCTKLKEVQLSDNLQTIGGSAFYGDYSLTEITIPSTVTEIGASAFYGCTSLETVTYNGAGLQTIGNNAFNSCTSLGKITVPSSVTQIGTNAFSGCTAVTEVEFLATACTFNSTASPFNNVGSNGFTLSVGAENAAVTILATNLFRNTNVTEVTFNNVNISDANFGTRVFESCTKLKVVHFSNACEVETIGVSAFFGCTALADVVLPAGLKEIGSQAFQNCTSVSTLEIPATVTTIANTTFSNCTRLFEVKYTGESSFKAGVAPFENVFNIYTGTTGSLTTTNGFQFIDDNREGSATQGKHLLLAYVGEETSVTLPTESPYIVYSNAFKDSGVSEITVPDCANITLGVNAFAGNKNLVKINLPDSLTEIPEGLFNGCASLEQINLPSKLKIINKEAFYNTSLKSIVLPQSLEEIGSQAFAYTNLVSVTIPSSIKSVGSAAFSSCENLKTVYLPSYSTSSVSRSYSSDICSGTNAVIIAASEAAYNEDKPDFNINDKQLTYIIEINLVYNNETHIEKVLFGLAYGYVYDEETNAWARPEEATGLPVQEGYTRSVWFENANYSGNAVTAARLETLLSGSATVTLYARHILPPIEGIEISYGITKNDGKGIPITVSGLNELFKGDYTIPEEHVNLAFESFNGDESTTLDVIKGVGIYSIAMSFDQSGSIDYGEWSNAHLIIQVVPELVDISTNGQEEDTRIQWGYNVGGTFTPLSPTELGEGVEGDTLYIYNGTPYLVRQDDLGINPIVITVRESYVLFNNDNYVLSLNKNPDFFTVVSYSKEYFGRNAAVYTASVTIKLSDNYRLLTDFDENAAERLRLLGIRLRVNEIDGTATIEKDWYIVAAVNDVLKDDDTAYSITGWLYNNITSNAQLPTAPKLRYCNDKVSELITFSLNLDGKEIMKQPAAYGEFGNYFNASMPAGDYVLTLYIGACSYGGNYFPVSERRYQFTIGKVNLNSASLSTDAELLKGKTFTYKWDGSAHYYDVNEINLSTLGTNLHPARTGAWQASIYDEYYSGFAISYNLLRQHSNEYFKADDPQNQFKPIEPDTYTVYFQLSSPSYVPLVNVNSDERLEYYFTVYIYRVLSDFEVTGANYTGEIVRPIVDKGPYLSVIWLDNEGLNSASSVDRTVIQNYFAGVGLPEEYISAGYHKFVLKIENPTYYQWDKSSNIETFGDSKEYGVFQFQIYESQNVVTTHLNLIRWSWGDYDPTQNVAIWVTQFGSDADYTFTLTLNRDESIKYIKNGIIDEFGNAIAGEYTLRAECKGGSGYGPISEEITVNIQKATNYWKELPNLERWVYGTFNEGYVAPTAEPAYKSESCNVVFYYYKADSNHNAITTTKYLTIDELLEDGEVPAGKYVLVCELEAGESENFDGLKSEVKFTVLQSDNYWDITPNLTGWVYGGYNESVAPVAKPHFGEVSYYTYYKLDDNGEPFGTPYYSIEDLCDANGQIPVGSYRLTATVNVGNNYKQMVAGTNFTVSRLSNYWTETPNVVRWYYGEYDKGVNLIYAVPAFGEAKFTVYTLDSDVYTAVEFTDDSNNTVTSFVLDEGGFVPDYIAKALSKFNSGTYYLLAYVEESGNYSGINSDFEKINLDEATLAFNILKAQNYWIDVPTIIGWIEGKYDEAENKITVLAKYGTVILTVTDRDGKVIVTSAEDGTLDLSKLKSLSIGNYELNAFVAIGDNYSGLDSTTSFAVFEDSVGVRGLIAAFMVFAVFALLLAVGTVVLLILRRRKLEAEFRKMIHTELNRR